MPSSLLRYNSSLVSYLYITTLNWVQGIIAQGTSVKITTALIM